MSGLRVFEKEVYRDNKIYRYRVSIYLLLNNEGKEILHVVYKKDQKKRKFLSKKTFYGFISHNEKKYDISSSDTNTLYKIVKDIKGRLKYYELIPYEFKGIELIEKIKKDLEKY